MPNSEAPREPLAVPPPQDPHRRPWEFTLAGSGGNDEDFDVGSAAVAASAGYYFTEVIQLVLRQNAQYVEPGPGPDVWNFQSRVALDLHFPLGSVVPFIGANAGYVYGDSVNDQFAAGPEAGVKLYLKDDAFLLGMAEWEFFFEDDESIDTAFDDGQLIYTIGIGLRF